MQRPPLAHSASETHSSPFARWRLVQLSPLKPAAQVAPHEMPAGWLVTVPVAEPRRDTLSVSEAVAVSYAPMSDVEPDGRITPSRSVVKLWNACP